MTKPAAAMTPTLIHGGRSAAGLGTSTEGCPRLRTFIRAHLTHRTNRGENTAEDTLRPRPLHPRTPHVERAIEALYGTAMSWQLGATALPKRLLSAFLLREPERRVRAFTSAQHKAIARYHAAAGRRTQVARNLQGPTEAVAAISLYREAAVLLIAAIVQTTEETEVTP